MRFSPTFALTVAVALLASTPSYGQPPTPPASWLSTEHQQLVSNPQACGNLVTIDSFDANTLCSKLADCCQDFETCRSVIEKEAKEVRW